MAAAEGSSTPAAATRSGGGSTADSYIGSLISLTSKSEIRYEGVLYTINTEESSIGLRNVRSFGTEGRKKDGPQIPASDKIYEYILFRGSDIKDLQVKSSPPVQPAPPPAPIHNDPAIIQSHYARPSLPATTGLPTPDLTSSPFQRSPPFQTALPPLYQPGSGLPQWVPPPPAAQPASANGSGITIPPMYWQGYYPQPPGTFAHLPQPNLPQPHLPQPNLPQPHLPQQPLLRTPPGLTIPNSFQYPGLTGSQNLPDLPASLQPGTGTATATGTTGTNSTSLTASSTTDALAGLLPNKPLSSSISGLSGLPLVNPLAGNIEPGLPSLSTTKPLAYQSVPVPPSGLAVTSSGPVQAETAVLLLTPGQLLQTTSQPLSAQPLQTNQPSPITQLIQTSHKEIEPKPVEISKSEPVKPVESKSYEPKPIESKNYEPKPVEPKNNEPLLPELPAETKEPLLPSPVPSSHKTVGVASYAHYNYRGRGRGRGGSAFSRQVTKFTEDFDFTAMNEKFNKDEVWGHLGKSKELNEHEPDETVDDEETLEAAKPVYVKDDFFDSLSCNALDRGSRNGRTKFSEQMKIDTETFGNFPRHRPMPMRGGGGMGRGPRSGYRGGGGRYYNSGRGGYGYNFGRWGGRGATYSTNNHASYDK